MKSMFQEKAGDTDIDRDGLMSALREIEDDNLSQPFIVSEGIGMLAAYFSIQDVEVRQSIKQLVEKIAFAHR